MKFFSSLKQKAINFLEPYKTKGPATYAAAAQAIGLVLIIDGLVGIESPFGEKKRPGIFGTIGGMVLGVIFMFIPTFVGNISGIKEMTALTSAKIISVDQANYTRGDNGGVLCTLTVSYSVNDEKYTSQSRTSSSDYCFLSPGQTITINYNPTNPGLWTHKTDSFNKILKIFFWIGLLVLISSIITFSIRLISIIFGWKLLRHGRKIAAGLPAGTNLQTMIDEIKQNFTASIFGFGGTQSGHMPGTPPTQESPKEQ